MKYMLDTNICIYLIKRKPENVINRFKACSYGDLCISSITLGELEYGVCKSRVPERNKTALNLFVTGLVTILSTPKQLWSMAI